MKTASCDCDCGSVDEEVSSSTCGRQLVKASRNGSFTPIWSQGAEDIHSLVGQARRSFPEEVRTPGAGGGGQDSDYLPPDIDFDSKIL